MRHRCSVSYSFLLSSSLLFFFPIAAFSQSGVLHPHWAPRTWQLRPDDITTVMGFRAKLAGNLNVADRPTAAVLNNAFIRGFMTEDDVMTWEVNAPDEASYDVSLLYTGNKEFLEQTTLEVASGSTTIIEKANVPNWNTRPTVQRHTLKQTLPLKKGINQVSFRLVDFQGTQADREALESAWIAAFRGFLAGRSRRRDRCRSPHRM